MRAESLGALLGDTVEQMAIEIFDRRIARTAPAGTPEDMIELMRKTFVMGYVTAMRDTIVAAIVS